ncbi:NAD(P)-dependent oxidoreductase [Paralimibaculum aggregatum]|uniref:NAD(P)-dependent oxidoreductase n=1 Tax=Paralimibaculum aggregatum TaxID=3036245 RepID=A0ABQ6LS39_9RHOB|nr:NAD(P)-dependent oxidoreductase [Limibaculum sp. NKW23]GMG84415.1 NAD(P)-dependent oxidoreductase [Limibaculum sp. NKW23]
MTASQTAKPAETAAASHPDSSGAARTPGIAPGRLPPERLAGNFADLHPPLSAHEALVAADRCYFCHDAPCVTACPTGIDIPMFIRQIAAERPVEAARTIFEANILGGICARVCPTETLCEEACVRETAEGKPVEIGRLQRFATDAQMATGAHPFARAAETGRRIAVVGAGPAGLAAAHRLAMLGHGVTVYDAREKPGGLNEYGIAAYKAVGGFAGREVDWLLGIGGITIRHGRLGAELTLDALAAGHDAVLLAMGLAGVNALGAAGEELPGARPATAFIAELRQAADLSALPVGRNVVVVGGGMTAIDAAVQSKLLGAETVTIVYRRGRGSMPASRVEQDHAAAAGVAFRFWARPVAALGEGALREVEFEYTRAGDAGLEGTGETFRLPADQLFTAIGQVLEGAPEGIALERGKIAVDAEGRSSRPGVWAAGDCAAGGDDLTVTAVAEGRDAAMSIHRSLTGD